MTPNTDSVAVLLAKLPDSATLDAVDDAERTGKRPVPITLTIGECRALRAALSAQREEPVAWAYRSEDPYDAGQWMLAGPTWEGEPRPNRREVIPLYLHPAPPGSDAVTEALRQLPRYRPTIHTVDQGRKMAAMDPRLPNCPTIPADPREWVRWSDIEAALAARTGKGEANV